MKRILITGAGSYIGTSVERWLNRPGFSGLYHVETIDMKGEGWKQHEFTGYDTVFHVAGIAHADIGKVTAEQKKGYYRVNCDLAVETAEKAKKEGVKQFIYMSSIIIYGEGTSVRKNRVITGKTEPSPSSFYGDSKWMAEKKLRPLDCESFHVAVLRPPMIYGEGGRGNYRMLKKIALKSPVFPDFPNQRSMLHIDNLCEYVRRLAESSEGGVFFPQDSKCWRTADLVAQIGREHGKKVHLIKGFNWGIYLLGLLPGKTGRMVNKAFGSLTYEKSIDISFGRFDDQPVQHGQYTDLKRTGI